MIKIFIKFFLYLLLIIFLSIGYLSFFGFETNKFNNQIKKEILEIDQNLRLELKTVQVLLDPFNFKINIKTLGSSIIYKKNKIDLESVNTKVSINSFLKNNFSLEDLEISTKAIRINNLLSLISSLNNTIELFLLKKVVKDGYIVGDLKVNFDKNGKIQDDYQINGYIKRGKVNFFKTRLDDLNLIFKVKKHKYEFEDINTKFNDILISSSKIVVQEKNNLYNVNGKLSSNEKDINIEFIESIINNDLKNLNNLRLSSENSFSFDISENKKIQNLEINSKINLIKLDYKDKLFSLKKYLPNFKELIKVKNHLITLKYQKDYWELNGKGKILIGNDQENINYKILKKKEHYSFHTGIQFFKSIILADTLKYKKDKDTKANLELSGTYNKNKNLNFDSIFFQENNNSFLLEGLKLNKKLKISSISFLDLNFTNSNKILNQINLRKKNKKYDIKGKVFDATPILETILDKDVSDSVSIYDNLNTKVKINIEKVYLDKNTYVKKLRGDIQYRDNEIFKLNLNSFFPNNKSLDLTINTNDDKSKITTLYSDYPKPLVQRYKFIQGFSEGTLDFYSLKKNGITNSVLKIDNFKIKKVPVFAKLLTLASLQGISDLLTGEGIRFKDFEMKYSNEGKLMTIEEIYAIGPAVSIMIDGYIERKKTISLRGTLVPATTINRTISSIPLLGNILVGKKVGEGVFGVSFKIKGPPNNLKTTVNPIKTLTPRFITRTLEKIKKD